jgi:hypothetical protein
METYDDIRKKSKSTETLFGNFPSEPVKIHEINLPAPKEAPITIKSQLQQTTLLTDSLFPKISS